ncbi:MAG: molybdopterin converting factor subunit 1 [Pacificimonas sp.]
MNLRLLYFARVREAIGLDGEKVEVPDTLITVAEVLARLQTRGAGYAEAFADTNQLRFSLDQQFVGVDAHVSDGAELGIFPPVTGG